MALFKNYRLNNTILCPTCHAIKYERREIGTNRRKNCWLIREGGGGRHHQKGISVLSTLTHTLALLMLSHEYYQTIDNPTKQWFSLCNCAEKHPSKSRAYIIKWLYFQLFKLSFLLFTFNVCHEYRVSSSQLFALKMFFILQTKLEKTSLNKLSENSYEIIQIYKKLKNSL